MTRSTVPEPKTDRDATVSAYSGGSPPRPPTAHISADKTQCPKGHPLDSPGSYYITKTGLHQCMACRLEYLAAWRVWYDDPARLAAEAQAIADERARRAIEVRERR